MQTNILIKCVEMLKGDSPDLSYVRGMLETLVEMQTPTQPAARPKTETPQDEVAILDAKAKAAIETIKAMGGTNTPQ